MAQPLSAFSLPTALQGRDPVSLSALGKAFSLKPGLATNAADQVLMGPSGLSHLTKSLGARSLNPLNGPATHSDEEVRQVAKNFESIFLQMLMKEMRSSVQRSDLLGNSRGMEFFESMFDEQMTKQLSSAGGIGLGQMVYNKLQTATVPHQKTFE